MVAEIIEIKATISASKGRRNGAIAVGRLTAVGQERPISRLSPSQKGVKIMRDVAPVRPSLMKPTPGVPRPAEASRVRKSKALPELLPARRRPRPLGIAIKRFLSRPPSGSPTTAVRENVTEIQAVLISA